MPGMNGTGPAGMGPMTGGGRGWCNPYSSLNAGVGPYPAAYPYASPYGAPAARWPGWGVGLRRFGGFPWGYGLGRPRRGLRGFWGTGWGGRGRRRWW
jgi:hypothetical protein